jgi:hypothetical protein
MSTGIAFYVAPAFTTHGTADKALKDMQPHQVQQCGTMNALHLKEPRSGELSPPVAAVQDRPDASRVSG